MGFCVQREWVEGGDVFCWYFWEQGLPAGVPKCFEGLHRRCIDNLGRQFIAKWDSANGESVLTTAGIPSLLVELIGVAA